MSLINQMLKELDARSSEVTGMGGAYGGQIRAVPDQRRVHPAWWVALFLAAVLIAVLVWMLVRAPVPVQAGAVVQLPLKIDSELERARSAKSENAKVSEKGALPLSPIVTEVVPASTVHHVQVGSADHQSAAASTNNSGPAALSVPEPVVSITQPVARTQQALEKSMKTMPANPKSVAVSTSFAVTEEAKPSEIVAPVALNKQVKELTPQQHAENEYRKAVSLMQQGKVADAINGLEQVLQLDAQHIAARQALIGLFLEGKRQDEAMQQAREGLGIHPGQIGFAMILARLQVEKNELSSAIETLERSLPYGLDRADYQAFLAALLQRDGRHKQASEHYLRALQKAPQNGVWWMGLGISFQADRQVSEAQEAFKRAKATNTLSPELLAFVESRINQLQR